ncbi:MAG: SDR family NAD(P)-dependent oxidoreductase [Prochloraceae cyanobacterium]
MKKDVKFSEKVFLITGASYGIGAATAEMLAAKLENISLVITARSKELLEKVASKCRASGAKVLVIPADLADTEAVKKLAKNAIEQFGGVDILINNAGYGQMGPIELVTPEDAKKQFAVNFHGPLILSQALIPLMRDRGGGKIINVSSLGGRMAFPTAGLYSCSKFALEALSDVLRMELGGFNIKVSVVEPGPVKTEFVRIAREKIANSLPKLEKTPYAPIVEKLAALERQTENLGWTAEGTAKVILRAIKDRNPRPRYVAATGGEIFLFLMTKILPTRATDFFWKIFYGIDRIKQQSN